MSKSGHEITFDTGEYHLEATLNSGQAFRWTKREDSWVGIVSGRWVKVRQEPRKIIASTIVPQTDWRWLANYLQVEADLDFILSTFPKDETMTAAMAKYRGLRLLRQDPWECLASFILSSTKQIVQIRQIIAALSTRFGTALEIPSGEPAAFSFPTVETLARSSEADLRACKMGFRAPYLLETARKIEGGEIELEGLRKLPLEEARERLVQLPGVGDKIADCVLLFAYGFTDAFPVDVWMLKVLRQHYFRRRKMRPARLREFAARHFGPHAGYAQQYLFHWIRTGEEKELSD